ncbi:MAG: Gfo/Idh/MocA family oxidoreductase [Thermomicrobiales bacterium]|nr:Gfo/Idh/MocA family oxidoreductase [Thermomicrobiales bacterium]
MKVAILGAGFMGGTHARAFQQVPGVEIAAIYAHSDRRAAPLAQELGTTYTDRIDRILNDDSIDAIDNCLPTPEHRPLTEAALAAGKHVLLEKPIALTDADAAALVAASDASDKVFMLAHVLRFWPEYIELQKIATDGTIGELRSGVAYRRQPFPAWSELFARSDLTGGAVIDMMIHDIDAANWVFGTPVSVTANGIRNPRSNGWDQVQVLIDYGTASALIDGGMMMPDSYPFSSTLQVLGSDGFVQYDFRAGGRSVEEAGGTNELALYPAEGDPKTLEVAQKDPYLAEIEYFVECVRSGKPATRATPAAARLALATALAARESIESNRTVTL